MPERYISPEEREKEFNKYIVAEYLKYGSVDEVFKNNDYNLPISYPGVQRLLDRWGIVKAAGPNSKLSEAITFMVLLSDRKIPMERLYKSLPPSFKTSMGTMHRILHNIKEGVVRRMGSALVVTPFDNSNLILVGDDISTPRIELGKPFGSTSLPMGYSKQNEDPQTSILRILQQEVFTNEAVNKSMSLDILPKNPKPFMYLDIADVRVAIYHLDLPKHLSGEENFSSFKLKNFRFLDISEIMHPDTNKRNFRAGIIEITRGFEKHCQKIKKSEVINPLFLSSLVNLELASVAAEFNY